MKKNYRSRQAHSKKATHKHRDRKDKHEDDSSRRAVKRAEVLLNGQCVCLCLCLCVCVYG